jgi:hypothetical protein
MKANLLVRFPNLQGERVNKQLVEKIIGCG